MKKRTKSIIAGISVLAVLSGGLLALKLTEPTEKEGQESTEATTEDTATQLWEKDSDTIEKISIKNAKDSYDVIAVYNTVVDEESGEKSEERSLFIKGYEELKFTTILNTTATRCAGLTTVDTVEENASDLSKYGLDHPSATVKTTYADKSTQTFYLGNVSPLSAQTYFMAEGDSNVYTVSTSLYNIFLYSVEEYVNTIVEPEANDDSAIIFENISIERKDLDYEFELSYDHFYDDLENGGTASYHVISKPISCNVNPEHVYGVTNGIFGLDADEVIKVHPSKSFLKECGLDDPFGTITFEWDKKKETVLKIGDTYETESGETRYYIYYSAYDVVYGIAPDSMDYDDATLESVASKLLFVDYVWDIGKVTVTADGMDKFVLENKSSNADDAVSKLNGKEVDSERFRQFYVFILKTYGEDIVLDGEIPKNAKPIATITTERQDGKKKETVEFYESEGLKVLVVVDGNPVFKCRKAFVETLIENCNKFNSEEAFTTHW